MKINNKLIVKLKLFLIVNLSLFILFVGISALRKAIIAVTMQKTIFEVIGFYISVFAFHFSNSILKDCIKQIKH